MQLNPEKKVAALLKRAHTGLEHLLGAEAKNGTNDLLKILAGDVHSVGLEACHLTLEKQLDALNWTPEQLVQRLMMARSETPGRSRHAGASDTPSDEEQKVAVRLKSVRLGLKKYLGDETDNAVKDLAKIIAVDLQTAGTQAYETAIDKHLEEFNPTPEELVLRLIKERASTPSKQAKKRARNATAAGQVVTSPNVTSVPQAKAESVQQEGSIANHDE
jgi:hypothetical protein